MALASAVNRRRAASDSADSLSTLTATLRCGRFCSYR